MSTQRESHTATLLANGKVLIAGGDQLNRPSLDVVDFATTELYDPAAGTFTTAGNMNRARSAHTSTMLPNGQVLIAGGSASGRSLASAELYDPITGSFSLTGDMTTPRAFHTATLLGNGRVLITGGFDGNKVPAATAELYDPSSGVFTRTGDMTSGRAAHTATLLTNGTVLIEGKNQNGVDSADIYDPDTGAFRSTGEETEPAGYAYSSAAALLGSGKVLLTLTYDSLWSDQAKLYDPMAAAFVAAANMSHERYDGQTATVLPDGNVLIVGTHDYDQSSATADLYDPVTGTFHLTGDTDPGREGHTATLLPDGTVLLTGGGHFVRGNSGSSSGFEFVTLDSALVYHPAISTPSPVLFSLTGDGPGQGAIWHNATGLPASGENPAVAGEVLAMYTTNLIDGARIPPQVAVGGRLSEILFFGNALGYPGVSQVNFRMPAAIAPGPAVPVRLTYLARPSNEVTIGVK
jgi:hypothetical protein